MNKILVIIPAYNEEKNIVGVIKDVQKNFPEADILVLNDASTDQTSSLARKEAVTVLDMPFNLGIGGIIQTSYIYAREFGYDYAVQVDADGQHPANELKDMLKAASELNGGEAIDIVIASRFLSGPGYKSSLPRRIGIRYFSALILLLTGKKITDPTSGFRMINRKLIELFSQHYAEDYPEPEAVVLAIKKGYRVKEIPTLMSARAGGKSSITLLKSVYYMIKVTISILIIALFSPRRTP